MTLLSQVLSNAKANIKARGASVASGIRSQAAVIQDTPRAAVDAAVDSTVATARSAARAALSGDMAGAGAILAGGPAAALGAAKSVVNSTVQSTASMLASLGLSGGSVLDSSTALASAGPTSVDPGNALAGLLARPDPLMSFLWYVELPPLNVDGQVYGLPWYYVEEATVPFRSYEPRAVYRAGRNKNFAGKYNVDPVSLGIYLDDRGHALQYLQAWDSSIVAPFGRSDAETRGGGFRPPQNYHKDVFIYLLDFSKSQILKYTCIECWPQNVDALTLQSQSNERLIGRVTLNIGDIFPEVFEMPESIPDDRIESQQLGTSPIPNPVASYDLNRGLPVPTTQTTGQQAQAFPVEL